MVVIVTSDSEVDLSLTTKPTDISAVPKLLGEIVTGVHGLAKGDDQVRHEVIRKARALVLALQTPRETMVEHCWAQVSEQNTPFPYGECMCVCVCLKKA